MKSEQVTSHALIHSRGLEHAFPFLLRGQWRGDLGRSGHGPVAEFAVEDNEGRVAAEVGSRKGIFVGLGRGRLGQGIDGLESDEKKKGVFGVSLEVYTQGSFYHGKGVKTYDKTPNGHVLAPQHPESPHGHPSVTMYGGLGEDLVLDQGSQDGSVVALVNTSDRDRQLQVFHLLSADAHGVL